MQVIHQFDLLELIRKPSGRPSISYSLAIAFGVCRVFRGYKRFLWLRLAGLGSSAVETVLLSDYD
jgi:hypothetical protein